MEQVPDLTATQNAEDWEDTNEDTGDLVDVREHKRGVDEEAETHDNVPDKEETEMLLNQNHQPQKGDNGRLLL